MAELRELLVHNESMETDQPTPLPNAWWVDEGGPQLTSAPSGYRKGSEDSLLAARPGYQPGYRVALSGSELRREGDACEGRGRGGTDCAGHLHTPDCDARRGGPHALARDRVWFRR